MAKQLQVSPATLSRFMNKQTNISERTLNKIVLKFEDEIVLTKSSNSGWQDDIKHEICRLSAVADNVAKFSAEPILVKETVRMPRYRFDFFQEELKAIVDKYRNHSAKNANTYCLSFFMLPIKDEER
jgi:hypothetical protein